MSEPPSTLSSLARCKLQKCNLHRWVLLKNSIIRETTPTPSPVENTDVGLVEDEEINTEDADSFMFPDAGKLVDSSGSDSASEAQWLATLLQTLGEDDEDDFGVDTGTSLHTDDDFDQLSPLPSPMSSSDDLINQSYLSNYPYLAPYPPFHPPLVNSYHINSYLDSSFVSSSTYDDPLPYYELEDVADQPVPDAIEDLSDDESDSPLTPSVQSRSSLTLLDPATIPLPVERPRAVSHTAPHVFIDSDDSSFYPYELDPDPLPFSTDFRASYNLYQQEC